MKSFIQVLRATTRHFTKHKAARMGAALSYYAVFSIAPLGILVIALVGSIFDTQLVESSVIHQFEHFIGSGAGEFIESIIEGITTQSLGIVGTVLSILTILFGVGSLLSVIDSSLDELWETKVPASESRQKFFIRFFHVLQRKLPAFSIIPLIALLFLFFVSASVFLSLFAVELKSIITVIQILQPVALFLLGTVFFALIYRILPERKLPLKELLIGGTITSLLFLLGRILIGLYISSFVPTTLYGAAGSLVAILIWIYYSAQVFFFGASFTYMYSKMNGHLSK